MRERVVIAIVCLAVFAARAARAEGPAAPEHDAAFRNGLDQYARGNNIGAIQTWESLLGTIGEERGFKVLYNLGLAYQAVGDVTHAIERYGAFVRQVAKRQDVRRELADRASDAQARLEQLMRTHGEVHVRAPRRGGLVLTRIGTAEPRAAGYVVWLAPGLHELELFVGTDHVKKIQIDVEEGRTVDVDTSLAEERAAAPAPKPEKIEERHPLRESRPERPSSAWIWIGVGATAATLALPPVTFLVASNKKEEAEALGPGHTAYGPARASYETWRTMHYASYAVPALLGLATVAYVVLRPSPGSGTRIGITPSGAALEGRF